MLIECLRGFRCLNLPHSPFPHPRCHRYSPQPDLDIIPIEKIGLPLPSRDELPPILAGRNCVDWIEKCRDQFGYALPGWRKAKAWRRQLKNCERAASHIELIQDCDGPVGGADVDPSVPVTDRLLSRYGEGNLVRRSFDKGFTRAEDRDWLSLYVPTVVMPKRGKKNAAETQRESEPRFVALRRRHSAVESEINSLEQHGFNRCLDVGLAGYWR